MTIAAKRTAWPALAALAVIALTACAVQAPPAAGDAGPHPTVVLVHGAFADASGWEEVIDGLQADDYPVIAVANPLRGLASDTEYLKSVLDSITGPIILVGHSYGGAVITNAATGNENVDALVYVAAFVPDEGEVLGQFADPAAYPGALLTPDALLVHPYPEGAEATIDPELFPEIFAADLSRGEAANLAARQRPVSLSVFEDPSGAPAWKDIPSWYLVSSNDKAISPAAERFFAERAGSTTVEIDASHVAFMSHPDETVELIESAAEATGE